VHIDHGVELALERMGTTGYNVLPVVSRANTRRLLGVVALEDILEVYGLLRMRELSKE
jgi:CBS domain-containing protein